MFERFLRSDVHLRMELSDNEYKVSCLQQGKQVKQGMQGTQGAQAGYTAESSAGTRTVNEWQRLYGSALSVCLSWNKDLAKRSENRPRAMD